MLLFLHFRHVHHVENYLVFDTYRMFTVESMVRGYHVYQRLWEASVGEEGIQA